MIMARLILLFTLLFFTSGLVFLGTCAAGSTPAFAAGEAAEKPAQEIEIRVAAEEGRVFSVFLDSNRTTGYEWRLARPLDGGMVQLVRSEYAPPEGGRVGEVGREEWVFLAKGSGKTEILLEYVRPWEKGQPPAAQARVKVSIKPAP
jgi:predicted secreted protein